MTINVVAVGVGCREAKERGNNAQKVISSFSIRNNAIHNRINKWYITRNEASQSPRRPPTHFNRLHGIYNAVNTEQICDKLFRVNRFALMPSCLIRRNCIENWRVSNGETTRQLIISVAVVVIEGNNGNLINCCVVKDEISRFLLINWT